MNHDFTYTELITVTDYLKEFVKVHMDGHVFFVWVFLLIVGMIH